MEFVDLKAQRDRLGGRIEVAIARVLDHGRFILGPEVAAFEKGLCEFSGAANAVTCANGTDALALVMMAEAIGPGDAVFVPSFPFGAPAERVPPPGPAAVGRAIAWAKGEGLRPRMVVAVDLFGLPADYAVLAAIANAERMTLVADAAQGFGGSLAGARVGTLADYTTTSFFPAKPLGCYGDGGAVLTDNAEKAALLASLRFHGKGRDKYDNVRLGLNSRLDTLQAAILIEKLAIFAEEIEARNRIAARYSAALADVATCPVIPEGYGSAWAQYTLRTDRRDAVAAACQAAGVPTAVYYPIPLHRQTGYRDIASAVRPMPVSEAAAAEVISLPMHPYLGTADQDRVIAAVRAALG